MTFDTDKSLEILVRTPEVLQTLLEGLSDAWLFQNEGGASWCPFDVVGHLIHGEKTDWIARMEIILSNQPDKTFESFDRFAQFENSKGKNLQQLLAEFKALRLQNIAILKSKNIDAAMLRQKGTHPELGEVTLAQLLATWVAHDLGHIAQISRVMAKQYKEETGPWQAYLPILHK